MRAFLLPGIAAGSRPEYFNRAWPLAHCRICHVAIKKALAKVTAFLTGCRTDGQALAPMKISSVFALPGPCLVGRYPEFARVRWSDQPDRPAALPARTEKWY
jgi:hypothetical protein